MACQNELLLLYLYFESHTHILLTMKPSFLFLAEGFEEVEAITAIDVLRRAGIPVKTISISESLQVRGAHNIVVKADCLYDNTLFVDPEWLILPGGMPGAENLYEFAPLQGLLKAHAGEGGKIAAICAAPAVVLGRLGLLKGKQATCYPGFESELTGAEHVDAPAVTDGNIVTGNGPANALLWALYIVREAIGEQEAVKVANGMLFFPAISEEFDFG